MEMMISQALNRLTRLPKFCFDYKTDKMEQYAPLAPFPECFYEISEARPFMLSKACFLEMTETLYAGYEEQQVVLNTDIPIPEPVSLPFKIVWLEIEGGRPWGHFSGQNGDGTKYSVGGFYIKELSINNNKYEYEICYATDHIYEDIMTMNGFMAEKVCFDGKLFHGSLIAKILIEKAAYVFKRMNNRNTKLGTVKMRQKFKIKKDGKKVSARVPDVIFIALNKSEADSRERHSSEGLNLDIDWSHRWEVMGHWRKHDGIGKDRSGERVVEGWTWVKAHTKGPGRQTNQNTNAGTDVRKR